MSVAANYFSYWEDEPTRPDQTLCCLDPACGSAALCNACILRHDRCDGCGRTPVMVCRMPGKSPIPLCAACAEDDECTPIPVLEEVTAEVEVPTILAREVEIARSRHLTAT